MKGGVVRKRACVFFSGGKDSTYALHRAYDEGYEISCIASVKPRREDSYMFHYPLVELTKLQVEAMGFNDRHKIIEVSGEKEKEILELYNSIRVIKDDIEFDTLVIGGISSRYQQKRFKVIAEKLEAHLFNPQWNMDQERYLYHLLEYGIVFIISQITSYGLPEFLLGIPVDRSLVKKIVEYSKRYGFNPSFEGGEAETFVLKAPLYKHDICLRGNVVKIKEFEYHFGVVEAYLCNNYTVERAL